MTDPFGQPAPPTSGRAPYVRNHRYRLFHPETGEETTWTRVTTFAEAIETEYNLTRWKLRKVVEGLGAREDLRALAVSIRPETPEARDAYQQIAADAMAAAKSDEGANRGTAMHALLEDLDRGNVARYPDETWQKDAESYIREMEAYGLAVEPDLIERYVVCPELELCGRLDRVAAQIAGGPEEPHVIVDAKTAAKIEYGWLGIAVQLAIYAHASHYWSAEHDAWVPMPPMNLAVGVVAHVKIGSGQTLIRPIDIAKGWEYAKLCREVRKARASTRYLELGPDALGSRAVARTWYHRISEATAMPHLAAIWDEATARGEWTADLERTAHERAAAIRAMVTA